MGPLALIELALGSRPSAEPPPIDGRFMTTKPARSRASLSLADLASKYFLRAAQMALPVARS
jgi:hypothetical protein